MYKVKKRLEIAGSHKLKLDYESKCSNIHGHNWIITVYCASEELDGNGMVMDFSLIKKLITDKLDHKHINDEVDFNPTAENMAKWVCDQLGKKCYKVVVIESENNEATYEKDWIELI